jgi:tryptophan-rich sensory protein
MHIIVLIVALILVAAVALSDVRFRPREWYRRLAKPPWTPPNWLFAPAWTVLYILVALAIWFAWRFGGGPALIAVSVLWVLQLIANALWSWIFFGRERIALALADILLLLVLIAATLALLFYLNPIAGALFAPYLLWVAFASGLNFSIWRRNRENL